MLIKVSILGSIDAIACANWYNSLGSETRTLSTLHYLRSWELASS
jgi:hypothetical protein